MPVAGILEDVKLPGTVLRGLVKQGPFCLLGYLGVPSGHWAAEAEYLDFSCHGGITFQGEGDGENLPKDWYWYGWDYAHAGDALDLPSEVLARLAPDAAEFLQGGPRRKLWTTAEVKEELLDSALRLWHLLASAQRTGLKAGLSTDTSENDGLFRWVPNLAG